MPFKDPEKQRASRRASMARRYKQRMDFIHETLGGVCAICGSSEGLQVDHIDRSTKSANVSWMYSMSMARLLDEMAKCQLLCHEHHNSKTLAETGKRRAKGEHGTVSTYRYCKCPACKHAHSEYMSAYYRSHPRNRKRMVAIV